MSEAIASTDEPGAGTSAPDAPTPLERRVGRALTLLAWALLPYCLWQGWGAWNDVLVDFGRELYVPWRLTEGDVLYRDVAYFNGPLSPHWNALWFSVLGPSLRTLTIVNAVLLALFGALLHRRVASAGGPIAAGATLLLFFPLFACGHFPGIGNYNFLAPYSHEMTHGLLLALLAFSATLRATAHGYRGWGWPLASGVLCGLCFLTKAEITLALGGAVGYLWLARGAWRDDWQRPLALVLGALAPVALACALLSMAMPFDDALRGTLGTWSGILSSDATRGVYYATYMGLDRASENLTAIVQNLGWLLLLFAPAAVLDRLTRTRPLGQRLGAAALAAAAVGGAFAARDWDPFVWMLSAQSLPVVALLAFGLAAALALRAAPVDRGPWTERAGFAFLAGLLMLKILLAVLLCHYGFVLSVLGAALLVVVVAEWLPRAIGGDGLRGPCLRAAALAWVLATAFGFWSMSEQVFDSKTVVVGEGADAFRADAVRGEGVRQLAEQVETRLKPEYTLLVLPEGIMVNYLTRRRTPTRHVNFMPPELDLFGEDVILQDLRDAPDPAAVALVHKDTSEYGVPLFGVDYGQRIGRWVQRRFQADWRWGDMPLTPETRFGVAFFGHK